MSATRIRALVNDLVEAGETDPTVIVEKVLADLAADEIAELARAEVARRVACGLGSRARTGERNQPTTGEPQRSERMATLAEASHDIARWLVDIAGDWKPLLDCTVDEVRHVASRHITEAKHLADQARRYDALAKRMQTNGADTVAALPRGTVEDLMLR